METDSTLIERSLRGRPDAFVEVVRQHEAAVHGFLARRAGPQVAADLLGEVWVRAFAGRGGYDPAHQDARPWLYGIARNVLRAHWRGRRAGGPAAAPDNAEDPWDDVVGRLDAAAQTRTLVGALLAPGLARVFGTARALVLTTQGYGLAGLLIPLTGRGPRLACYLIGSVLIAGGLVVGNVIIGSFRQQYCPPSLLGRVTASMRFLGYGMIPLGALLAGALGTALGVRDAMWIVRSSSRPPACSYSPAASAPPVTCPVTT